MLKAERVHYILNRLQALYPETPVPLDHSDPYTLLIAVLLSAQCTDERVNMVTPALFAKYPTPVDFAAADRSELEAMVRSTGFFRQKAKFIQESSHTIVHEHGGEVPNELDKLIKLNGVARKTANVVLGEIYGIADGITVDTHVKRIAHKLGLVSTNKNPVKVERELMAIVPKGQWILISHLLVFHGRRICFARRPDCLSCPLNDICPSAEL